MMDNEDKRASNEASEGYGTLSEGDTLRCPLCEAPPGWHVAGCLALSQHPNGPFPDYGERP